MVSRKKKNAPPALKLVNPKEDTAPVLPLEEAIGTGVAEGSIEEPVGLPVEGTEVQGDGIVVVEPSDADKSAKQPALKSNIKIFQIYYLPEQKKVLDKSLIPFDNSGVKNPLLEIDVFQRLAASNDVKGADYWGALSWRFEDKMGFSGSDFKQVIEANPGYDIYFCNPHVEIEALFNNLWVQGETAHPNFMSLSKEFLKAAGLPTSMLNHVLPSQFYATANYFVANKRFWDDYLAFVKAVMANADKNLPETIKEIIYSPAADRTNIHKGACYLPFILERLLSDFMISQLGKFKVLKITSPKLENKLTPHHKNLRSMKDVSTISKSTWMLGCWLNYRNLLLAITSGKTFMEKHSKTLNSKHMLFVDLKKKS